MKYDWIGKTLECLRENPEQQFTAREIAKWIFKNYREECEEVKRSAKIKSDAALLHLIISRIITQISRLRKKSSRIKTIEVRPRKYYYTKSSDSDGDGHPQATANDPTKAEATSSATANLNNKILECLRKNPEQKFTAREIAKWVFKNYREECLEKKRRSSKVKSDVDLLNRITGEVSRISPRLLKKSSRIKTIEKWPRKFYWTKSSHGDEPDHSQDIASDPAKAAATSSATTNLNNKFLECLRKNPEQKFTAREIAEWVVENYKEECEALRSRSSKIKTDADLLNRVASKINAYTRRLLKESSSSVKVTEDRPRKCYWIESNRVTIPPIKEKDLYPVLVEFLWSALKIYSKRIDEKRSSNSSGARANRWLYPDIVALEDLSKNWRREIKDCVKERSDKKARLWSFEVKRKISRSNVREYYFQAVSNSSWANFGYLAADEIRDEALEELQILAGLLGVGLIKLDREHPSGSQIVIPAKERLEVDWNAANRLAKENKDFLNFIKLVLEFYQTGNPRSWDTKIQRS